MPASRLARTNRLDESLVQYSLFSYSQSRRNNSPFYYYIPLFCQRIVEFFTCSVSMLRQLPSRAWGGLINLLQSIRTCFISIISCLNPFATSRQKNESEAKEKRELNLAYAELIPMLEEMKVEASDISKAVGDSKRQLDAIDFETINPAILEKIYEDEVEFSDLRRRFYDLDEMYAILNTAFKNAPDLTSENGKHSKLLNNLKIELMEHHQKIKILTDIYLEETANILGVNDSHAASQFSMNP